MRLLIALWRMVAMGSFGDPSHFSDRPLQTMAVTRTEPSFRRRHENGLCCFLKHWRHTGRGEAFRAHVTSFADDFVIGSRGHAEETLTWTKAV